MGNSVSKANRHDVLRRKLKSKTLVLNTIAEFLAAIIFSALYFIFISRYLSNEFSTDYIALAFSVGLAFFAAIYIPFHTYRIHVIPFISLITALRKRDPMILVYKIPAQLLGAFMGVMVFNAINSRTSMVNIEDFQMIHLNDPMLSILINTLTAAILCYGFYMIRVLFQAKQLSGTIYLSLYYAVLFSLTAFFSTVSALNPFGYLFYDLTGNQTMFSDSFLFVMFNHIIAPLVGVALLFFYIKPKVLVQKK
jgi:glycerol uptake facilitator-like aquaporin